jgi:hypothetical protein
MIYTGHAKKTNIDVNFFFDVVDKQKISLMSRHKEYYCFADIKSTHIGAYVGLF